MIGGAKIQNNRNMTVYEALSLGRNLLEQLQTARVRIEDVGYVQLYEDYLRLRDQGEKKTYIVACLSEQYGVCERKVYGIIKQFSGKVCTAGAV